MNVRQSPKSLGQSLQKIPHIPRNNLNTLKYLEIPKDKLTQNIQSYLSNTSTRPEPQPLPDFLLLQYPAQTDIENFANFGTTLGKLGDNFGRTLGTHIVTINFNFN